MSIEIFVRLSRDTEILTLLLFLKPCSLMSSMKALRSGKREETSAIFNFPLESRATSAQSHATILGSVGYLPDLQYPPAFGDHLQPVVAHQTQTADDDVHDCSVAARQRQWLCTLRRHDELVVRDEVERVHWEAFWYQGFCECSVSTAHVTYRGPEGGTGVCR